MKILLYFNEGKVMLKNIGMWTDHQTAVIITLNFI